MSEHDRLRLSKSLHVAGACCRLLWLWSLAVLYVGHPARRVTSVGGINCPPKELAPDDKLFEGEIDWSAPNFQTSRPGNHFLSTMGGAAWTLVKRDRRNPRRELPLLVMANVCQADSS